MHGPMETHDMSPASIPRRPTLRDVAERAGVSFKTVSRVVNGEPGVSEDVAARVAAAVQALGYRPDDRARRLRQGGSTRVIGFVLVDVANPFFSAILRGIEEVARHHGCLVLSGSTDGEPGRERQLVDAFLDRRVDGLVLVSSDPTSGQLAAEIDRGTPMVFLDLAPGSADVDLVRTDHTGGARAATEHLLAHGHRDIAFLGDDVSIFSARCRLDGYRAAVHEAGLPVRANRVVTAHHGAEQWTAEVVRVLSGRSRPTALFTAQNFVTIGAVRALHQLDLHHDVALVGFDDVELADLVEPGISVVPQVPSELGRRAAERLFERLQGGDAPPVHDILPTQVIARGSGEIPPPTRRPPQR